MTHHSPIAATDFPVLPARRVAQLALERAVYAVERQHLAAFEAGTAPDAPFLDLTLEENFDVND